MENLNELIGSVLSDPNSMAKLREAAGQLGLSVPDGDANPAAAQQGQQGQQTQQTQQTQPDGTGALSALAPAISRLAPLLGKLNEEDDMTRLIHALKPYLSGARLKRAEEADRIVSIMRVIPLLKQPEQEVM